MDTSAAFPQISARRRRMNRRRQPRLTFFDGSTRLRGYLSQYSQPRLEAGQKVMAEQYIFTIESLTKAYAKREVLKDIWLAFYPGAKIGVLGSNGAGKSSLLRIMAGADTDFLGSARLTVGFTAGWVPQEPRLTENKKV